MLRVGIAGFGFMGRMHFRQWKAVQGAQVVAICDANPNIREDTKRAVGNIKGAEGEIDFAGIEVYRDLDQMLDAAHLDAMSITLPTYLHADCSEKALSRGVHVLCEKPMALTVPECNRMIRAAGKSGKVLQIGHCVRFWPEYAKAKEIVDSGQYGPVVAGMFQRLGSAPAWSPDNWFADEARSGGVALDLHIHDADYVQYLLGMPKAVCSHGAKGSKGQLIHIVTEYEYGPDKVIVAEGGWGMSPTFGFEMSFNVILEKATLVYDCTRSPAFRVCPREGQAFTPEVAAGDGYSREVEHFVKTLRGESVPQVLTLEQSRDSVRLVQAERKSLDTNKRVLVK
ncbi:MAG TPA: Gfo/Idh/MocA family oxidoreductase [Sedimentisphaerales bacterium]|jgi:predicted dehydrogenase|nr:Gfo/Idh/MocA family oxidoreductase [Sedimentisphaerales bacterium]HNU30220.1 Gfo/Idh/MocA family oxidoreductase [Sedimentisphaerales bacterium]